LSRLSQALTSQWNHYSGLLKTRVPPCGEKGIFTARAAPFELKCDRDRMTAVFDTKSIVALGKKRMKNLSGGYASARVSVSRTFTYFKGGRKQ
jgi:hypothetical protein